MIGDNQLRSVFMQLQEWDDQFIIRGKIVTDMVWRLAWARGRRTFLFFWDGRDWVLKKQSLLSKAGKKTSDCSFVRSAVVNPKEVREVDDSIKHGKLSNRKNEEKSF